MKALRLTFLALLVLTTIAAPEAYGRGKKESGGLLTPAGSSGRLASSEEEWDIDCPNGRHAVCVGDEETCLFLCDLFCGTSPGACHTVN